MQYPNRRQRPLGVWLSGTVIVLSLGACALPGPAPEPPVVLLPPLEDVGPPAPVAIIEPAPHPRPARRRGVPAHRRDGPGERPPEELARLPDAIPRREPLSGGANRPYVLAGVRYTPMRSVAAYRQHGKASWYGRLFDGRKTANGERYDMYAMTAAHPTLPIPSYVRVRAVATGQTIVVRVNDRGPFLHGRAIDLSYAAACKLGIAGDGTADVDIESITFDPVPTQAQAQAQPRAGPTIPTMAAVAAAVQEPGFDPPAR